MYKLYIVLALLIAAALGFALVKRTEFPSEKQVRGNYLSEELKIFQGEWYAAPEGGNSYFTADFKGRSLRLVASMQWRKTYTVDGLGQRGMNNVIVLNNSEDAVEYRFESDDVLWLEFKPDNRSARKTIRFERVAPAD